MVPEELATEISRRTDRLLLWPMGAYVGCDAQYLFAMDILGEHKGKMQRHSKVYRNLAAECHRLQLERVAASSEFRKDVENGSFPEDRHTFRMDRAELAPFRKALG